MNKLNFKEKNEERKEILGMFKANYPVGCIKISSTEGLLHARVKCEVARWLMSNGYYVWSEPTLKGGCRPDLVCLHKKGTSAYIIEIVSSESESSLIKKTQIYPLPIIPVVAKDFKYGEFQL